MRKNEKKWASRVGLVGLLELQWNTPCHDQLEEFLNIYHIKRETIYARLGEKGVAIDKHLITNVFKFFNNGWKEQKQVDKQTIKAMFQCIALLGVYVNKK